MKKFLALLLTALLLCAVFSTASAKIVTHTTVFTAPSYPAFPYTETIDQFTLTVDNCEAAFFLGCTGFGGSIVSNDGTIIDRLEMTVKDDYLNYPEVLFAPGTKRESSIDSNGTVVHIDDVNATSISLGEGEGNYCRFSDITVYWHTDVPETGDAGLPVLWCGLALVAVAAMVTLNKKRRVA